jgi:hypothetical protein
MIIRAGQQQSQPASGLAARRMTQTLLILNILQRHLLLRAPGSMPKTSCPQSWLAGRFGLVGPD